MATAISAVFVSLAALAFALMLGQAVMPTTGVVVLRLDPQPTQFEFSQSDPFWDGLDLIVPMATPAPIAKPIPSAIELALRPSVIEPETAQALSTHQDVRVITLDAVANILEGPDGRRRPEPESR